MTEDDASIHFMSPEEAVVSPDGFVECYRDRHWVGHKDGRLVFHKLGPKKGPCTLKGIQNKSKEVAERIRDLHYPWAKIYFYPCVFVKRTPEGA